MSWEEGRCISGWFMMRRLWGKERRGEEGKDLR